MSRWLPEIRRRLAPANLDPAREAEIAQELEQHLDDRYREMRAEGFDDDEAARAALGEIQEDARMRTELATTEPPEWHPTPLGDPKRRAPLADLWQDVRYALRVLRRHPGFATLALTTLALGVGATTVVYAIVDNMLFRQIPYEHADRLVRVFEIDTSRPDSLISASYPNFKDWQQRTQSLDEMGIYRSRVVTLVDGDPVRVSAAQATPGFFLAAGAQPILGRAFTEADLQPGAPKLVILSHAAWLKRFGGDRNAIGRTIHTTDGALEIIGVLGPARMFAGSVELWVPLEAGLQANRRDLRGMWVLGRLREGVTLDQARAEMKSIAAALEVAHSENRGWTVNLMPMREWSVRGVRQPLYTFFAAVGCIMLIACLNVAGLLVARGAARSSEVAIRTSLGAGRWRIIRQLVTESLVLSILGAIIGTGLAWATFGMLLPLFPVTVPAAWVAVDARILAIVVAVSALTGILFGLVPAIGVSRSGAGAAMKAEARSTSSWGKRVGASLIVVEVALSLVLLSGAGLLVRSLIAIYGVDPAISVDRLVAVRATPLLPRGAAANRAEEFYRQLVARVAAAPGVESAAAIDTPPFAGGTFVSMAAPDTGDKATGVSPRTVTPGYFTTMGLSLTAGRDLAHTDTANSAKVVVINQTAAAKLWPGQSPIGRELRFSLRDNFGEPHQVVGVVADVRHDGLDQEPLAEIYHPPAQRPSSEMMVVARAADPEAIGRQFHSPPAGLPERALSRPPQTFASLIDAGVMQRRNRAILLAILAGLGLTLAAVGVFSLTAYSVTQRTKEIGVRIALGADGRRVLRTIVGSLVPPLGIGVLLGLVGSWWATQLLKAFLFGVEPTDPVTFAAVTALISAVGLLACYLPARRALRVDPVNALRAE